jgi:hypothetical protein
MGDPLGVGQGQGFDGGAEQGNRIAFTEGSPALEEDRLEIASLPSPLAFLQRVTPRTYESRGPTGRGTGDLLINLPCWRR